MNEIWFSHIKSVKESRLNIFCFPYVGGSPSFYAPWKRLLPENIGWYPVLYPGRELRKNEEITDSVDELVGEFILDNGDLLQQAPVVFMGHCTGTILAYESAKEMERRLGRPPELVVLSSSLDPQLSTKKLLKEIANDRRSERSEENLILNFLRKHHMIPLQILEMEGFCEYFLPIYIKDLKMFMNYKLESKYQINTKAFILYGNQDEMISSEEIVGWRDFFQSDVMIEKKEGDHYFINHYREEVISKIVEIAKGIDSIE